MEKKQQNNSRAEIDLIPLLKALVNKIWLMLIVGLVLGSVGYGLTKLLLKPTYRCEFTAYINNQHAQSDKNSVANSDLLAAQQITKTLQYIIQSNTIMSASLQSIDSDLTTSQLRKMVSTEIKDETELISVYVVSEDPEKSYMLATAISKTAPKYMAEIVEGSSMKIVDYPVLNTNRFGPSYIKYGLLGFLLGVLIIIIKTAIEFFKDDKIKSEYEIEERFDIPLLGIIPDVALSGSGEGYYSSDYGYRQTNERSVKKNEKQ